MDHQMNVDHWLSQQEVARNSHGSLLKPITVIFKPSELTQGMTSESDSLLFDPCEDERNASRTLVRNKDT
jgi:hypothetical protein